MRTIIKNNDNTITILIPTQQAIDLLVNNNISNTEKDAIKVISEKDVAEGLPFWVVEDIDVPSDRSMREAWLADETLLGTPTGYGHSLNTFEGVLL